MDNQEKVWDSIADKWDEFREILSPSVEKFLKDKSGRILDLGCGSGRNFSGFSKNAQIYAVDFSREMLKHAEEKAKKLGLNAKTFCSNSDKIPFENDYFDSAICIALLHCIPEKDKRKETIKEIYRALKPSSQVLISVWGRNSPRLRNKEKECFIPWTIQTREEGKIKQERFTYIYDLKELEEEVRETGFKIARVWEERNINIIAEK